MARCHAWRSPMTTTTISSREFNQDAGGAKRAAVEGPVIITDRGRPSHVLLTYDAYLALLGQQSQIGVIGEQHVGRTASVGDDHRPLHRRPLGAAGVLIELTT